jgi:hypothetical protein
MQFVILGIVAVIAVLIISFFIRLCPGLFAFLYCTGVGILLALTLLNDGSRDGTLISIALGGGVGALVGLVYALIFHADRHHIPFGLFLNLFIVAPVIELILGFVIVLILGLVAAAIRGSGDSVMKGGALLLGLLGAILGGGGTVYVVVFKR